MIVKTRVFLVFMSYVFCITIAFLYILNKHAFTDINMVLCWLSLYFFGLVIAYDYSKRETFFTFGIVFNILEHLLLGDFLVQALHCREIRPNLRICLYILLYLSFRPLHFKL